MVENLNLEEMQDNDKPKEAFEQLEELQKAGFGQDVTPFYRNKMQPALLNLAPEYQEFFTPGNTTYQKMLLGLLPIGYKNGVEPIVIDKSLSMEDKLSRLFFIQNNNDESVSASENFQASKNLLDKEGVAYKFKDGKVFKLDVKKQREDLNLFENKFGNFLPFVTGPQDLINRQVYEKELAELGLTPEKAKELQKKLKESHYYMNEYTGKISYHEQARDLSYLIPTEGDASFLQQFSSIMGRMTNDFPSILTGLGVAGIKQYNQQRGRPDEKLLSPYQYVNGRETKVEKTTENILQDAQLYIEQEEQYYNKLVALTEKFDEMQNTNTLFMPYKNFYKNIVYNNTGFVLDGKLLDQLAVQNPDESILFHIADTSAEAIPYVATLNGILGAFRLGGTKLADDAINYSLKNSGPGLKHANPIEAMNAFFQKELVTKTYGKNSSNKFIKRVQGIFENQLKTKAGVEKLKINLLDEINSIDDQIKKAISNNNFKLAEKLAIGKETLVARQAGLTVKHFTTAEKTLFRNEIFASTFGGVGDYVFGVNSGAAIGMELTGALVEPKILSKRGFTGLATSAAVRATSFLDYINIFSTNEGFTSSLNSATKSAYLNLKFENLSVLGDDGIKRNLTLQETKSLRAFTDILMDLPPDRRAEVVGRMTEIQSSLEKLKIGMSGEEASNFKVLYGQFTGLAALQALDEMYMVKIAAGNMTTDMLVQSNDYIKATQTLLREIDGNLSSFMQRPEMNPDFGVFKEKINTVIKEAQESIIKREEELLTVFDAVENYTKTGNMFDGTDIYDANMNKFFDDLVELTENGATDNIKNKAISKVKDLDNKILTHFENTGKALTHDGNNYNANWFSGLVDGLHTFYKLGAREKYLTLYNNHKNVRVDFTEFFDDIVEKVGGVERTKRYTKLSNPVSAYTRNVPSSYETNGLLKIIDMSAERNTLEFIADKNNHKRIIQFFDSPTEIVPGTPAQNLIVDDEILRILNMNQNLSGPNAEKVFNAIKKNIVDTFPGYKGLKQGNINALDVRDALGGDIPLLLNLQEAMEFKSGIGAMSKATVGEPINTVYASMFTSIDQSLLKSINSENNVALMQEYVDAVNTYSDFYNRFNNFKMLRTWTTYDGKGSSKQITQDKSGESSQKVAPVNSINKEGTEIVNRINGAENIEVPNYIHKTESSEWINWGKLLSDEKEAQKFMNDVVLPLVGERDISKVGQRMTFDASGQEKFGEYFINFNNPETITKLKLVSQYLQEEMGNHIRRTEVGKLFMNKADVEKMLTNNPPRPIDAKEIKIFNGIDETFSLGTGDNKIFLLRMDDIVNINVGIETAIARNATINNIARVDQIDTAKEYKRINQKIKKQVNDFKFNQKFFSDDSVILQFGTGLTKPDIFSEAIVESGSLDNYQKLYRALVDSKKLSEKEFKEVTRNLVSSQFFKKFSVVADDVKTVVKGQPVTQVTNLYTFKTAEAREYLTRNKNVLQEILGENHYNDIKEILDIQALLTGADISKVSVTPLSNSLSLESLMSRFYSISRGIISPRYVATEIAIRRYNKNKGVLIKTVLENPNMADVVLKILKTQDPYGNNKLNDTFYKLLQESTFKALAVREGLEAGNEYVEDYQDEFLTDLNTSLTGMR